MIKRRLSSRELLIEQCLYDAEFEREGSINEGFVDNIKANLRGAGEWLKQDAKDSFRLRKKDDIKSNRTNAKISGKVKSYAGSLAKTMKDFRNTGGTLGNNIAGIDDVINRLDQVSKGIAPRGVTRSSVKAAPSQQKEPASQNNNSFIQQKSSPASNQQKPSRAQNDFISKPSVSARTTGLTAAPATNSSSTNTNNIETVEPEELSQETSMNTSNNIESPNIDSTPQETSVESKPKGRGPLTHKEKIKWAKELGKRQRKAKKEEEKAAKTKAKRDAAREKRRQKYQKQQVTQTTANGQAGQNDVQQPNSTAQKQMLSTIPSSATNNIPETGRVNDTQQEKKPATAKTLTKKTKYLQPQQPKLIANSSNNSALSLPTHQEHKVNTSAPLSPAAPEKQAEDVSDNIKPLEQLAPTVKNSSKAKVKKSSNKPRKMVTAKDIQDKERIQQQRQVLDDYNAAIERGESPSLNTSPFREPQRKVLKFNKEVKPTRKVRTAQDIKDAKERKRQNKEMQNFLTKHNPENDPSAWLYDSYDPYRNSKGQLQMLNSIK